MDEQQSDVVLTEAACALGARWGLSKRVTRAILEDMASEIGVEAGELAALIAAAHRLRIPA